jgi:hypothetical protein
MRPRRFAVPATAVTLIVLVVSLAGATSASASRAFRTANFTASISGAYNTTAKVDNTGCSRSDTDGNTTYFDASGTASETDTFRSTKSKLFGVNLTRGQHRLFAGGPALPIEAKLNRSSTLEGPTEPNGCRQDFVAVPTDCGAKTFHTHIEVFGVGKGYGLSYNLSNGSSTTFPDDPFNDQFSCPLAEQQDWWGQYYTRGNAIAKVSVAKLFNTHVKRIVVKGHLVKTHHVEDQGATADSTETLSWMLVLKRRH